MHSDSIISVYTMCLQEYTGNANVKDYLEIVNRITYMHMGQNITAEQRYTENYIFNV